MARANELVGRWMARGRDGACASTRRATSSARCPAPIPDAGTLLLGSHLDTVRDAGAFDGPLGVLAAIAAVARLRAEEVTLPFARRRARVLRRGGPAVRHRVPRQPRARGHARRRRCSTSPTPDGVTVRAALGGDAAGARPRAASGCSATASCTSSRGRCSRSATRRSASSRRSPAPRAPSLRFRGRAGHAGTVPMALRRDAACAVAELVLAVEAAARAEPGLVATVGRLEALPGAPNVIPGEALALARRPPRRRRGARSAPSPRCASGRRRSPRRAASRSTGRSGSRRRPWRWTRR